MAAPLDPPFLLTPPEREGSELPCAFSPAASSPRRSCTQAAPPAKPLAPSHSRSGEELPIQSRSLHQASSLLPAFVRQCRVFLLYSRVPASQLRLPISISGAPASRRPLLMPWSPRQQDRLRLSCCIADLHRLGFPRPRAAAILFTPRPHRLPSLEFMPKAAATSPSAMPCFPVLLFAARQDHPRGFCLVPL